ncbi:MAG TPA: hypothetical protein PK079_00720 [Leptospiraceae bacterium]|nr:hypothetical protein [Leptospiraceae bacterium]HMW03966.1 hypothetical protein [Leptospiraceae bacterium]HMX33604.1 hypothetical protein [Leptospiraceae bacterium]HMY29946.1 hypothetical protein [Leptospiraceae bacterium]HMZ66777.1 hypothetical protein [Leptospiraceae bacterium]
MIYWIILIICIIYFFLYIANKILFETRKNDFILDKIYGIETEGLSLEERYALLARLENDIDKRQWDKEKGYDPKEGVFKIKKS